MLSSILFYAVLAPLLCLLFVGFCGVALFEYVGQPKAHKAPKDWQRDRDADEPDSYPEPDHEPIKRPT